MPNTILTPLMSLPNPVPGVDPGPDWADNIQSCFNILDGHNHAVGSGNQISSDGILLNADLPFNGFNATLLRSLRLSPQVSPLAAASDLGCLYESGVDLYYNDGNGNQVRITSGGNVNATSSGISSGTASAAFSGGILVVDSNTNTPANIQCGSVLIGNNTVSPHFVTVSPPNALAADYSLALPAALPASQKFLTLDTSGNIAAYAAIAGGITGSNIANGTITEDKLAAANIVFATFSITSTSSTAVSILSNQTFTTGGVRPILIIIQGPAASDGAWNISNGSGGTQTMASRLRLGYHGGSLIQEWKMGATIAASQIHYSQLGMSVMIAAIPAGTYGLDFDITLLNGTGTAQISAGTLVIMEN